MASKSTQASKTELRQLPAPGGAPAGRIPRSEDAYADIFDVDLEMGARDVRERLLEHGASLAFTAAAVRAVVRSGAKGAFAIDAAAKAIGRAFPILPSPKRKKGSRGVHIFVFVGPTGAGKTSTVAKLGRKMIESGRKVLFVSMDSAGTAELQRVGNVEADIDRAEVPIVSVRGAADLAKELRRRSDTEVVLLDTPGLSPRDEEALDSLAGEIDRIGSQGALDVLLVLPATKSQGAIELVCRSFSPTAASGCVLTKLDETDEPLGLLEEIARTSLPVAFLCDGLDTRAHLVRPTPDRFADLCLRGRYA